MKPPAELRAIIERLKRGTRNTDILDVCDAALEMLDRPTETVTVYKTPSRAAYMRDYRVRTGRTGKKRSA